ncbi:MAG: hypothetical protein J7K26_03670 [Candidatus Aenigmarchaeota archaeon]|nr:hypothetical protein [Candidatus Aenigmarchaeota archaeon]
MIIYKLSGFFLFIIGIAILRYFPDIAEYQHERITITGIWMAIIFVIVGLVIMIFM